MPNIQNISALSYLSTRLENAKTAEVNSDDSSTSQITNAKDENSELRIQNSEFKCELFIIKRLG